MEMLSTKQAAQELQLTYITVVRLVQDKIIPAVQLRDRGRYHIRLDDLQKYAQERGIVLRRELQSGQ